MRPATLNYPPNPEYGHGSCVRQISLRSQAGLVHGHLADNFHEMRCTVAHDAGLITRISCEALRIPTTACPAAAGQIQPLVGLPIDTPVREFYRDGRSRRHCTHLLDLVVLAIGHAATPASTTKYEAVVPDETDEPVAVEVRRNSELVHRWVIRDGIILEPTRLNGRTLDKGFAAWASAAFYREDLDAATILARTWLVAIGRRYLPAKVAGRAALHNLEMLDRCYAYSRSQIGEAVLTGEPEVKMDR